MLWSRSDYVKHVRRADWRTSDKTPPYVDKIGFEEDLEQIANRQLSLH